MKGNEQTNRMAEKPTLLVLTSTYPRWDRDPEPGFVHELSRRLTNQFRVIALCPHAPGAQAHETMNGVEVFRYRYAPRRLETLVNDGGIVTNLKRARWKYFLVPGFILAQMFAAWQLIRRERVDVIHSHWLIPQGLVASILQGLPGCNIPFTVTSHGADLYALKGKLLERTKAFVARRAAAATVVSSAMRERLLALGVVPAKVSVLPMGVDLSDRFTPDPSVVRSEREILFVGRLVEKKGLRYLLDALPGVLKTIPDVHLTVVGFGPDEGVLKRRVKALGIASSVHFVGAAPQAELPSYYRRAALFVAPFIQAESGDQEGLPVALMEAVACGCPVVAGDVAGIDDLLGDMKSQICVDARDKTALIAKVVSSLESPEFARECAVRVRTFAAERVSWDCIVAGYAKVLAQSLDPKEI